MSHDPAECPNCEADLTEYDDPTDGFLTFFSPVVDQRDRAEGHFDCPECGNPFRIEASLMTVERS